MNKRILGGLVLAALSISACGTTVPLAQRTTLGGNGANVSSDGVTELSPETGSVVVAGAGSTVGSSPVLGGGAVSGAGTGTAQGASGTFGSSDGTASATASSSGQSTTVSTKPVPVGFVIADDNFDGAAAAVGVSGLAIGNQRQQATALVNDINTHGGLLGRKVTPIFHVVKTTDTNPNASDQAACDKFTQDNKVQFVISINGDAGGSGLLGSCLAKRGAVFINDDYPIDEAFYKTVAGHFLAPSDWLLDRVMRTQTSALAKQGFFKGAKQVGVLLYDAKASVRVLNNVVIPDLRALGFKQPVYSAIASSDYFNEQSTVLKFQSSGVDRVLTIAISPLAFMTSAQTQGYHPRYAVYSTMGPGALLQTAVSPDQLKGAMGFGWSPQYDVDTAHNPGPVSPNETRCLTVMKNAGVDTSQPTTRALVLWFCDSAWYLQAAINEAKDISPAGLLSGARTLRGYQSPVTWRIDLSSGRPDGVAAYRNLVYTDSCSCFTYTSGLLPAA